MLLRLNLQLFAQEKTEKATPNKRQEARKEGQIAKSQEVSTGLTLLFCFSFFIVAGKGIFEGFINIYRTAFQEYLLWDLSLDTTQQIFSQLLWESAKLIAPLFLVSMVAGAIASYMQVGFMFNTDLIKIKLEKLNPIEGAKKILSLRSIVELVKSIFKITITALVVFVVIWLKKDELLLIGEKNIWDSISLVGTLAVQAGIWAAACLIALAALDYIYQKYEHEKQIRMSKQDVKDEHKKLEGDPFIQSKRKAIQRQMAQNRMMQDVPKADVVITNPTHFAIAIRYDFKEMSAPEVIAKGKDLVALKIKEIAKTNKIMTVENKPLARALYAGVEVGEPIPEDLFHAVGEILAYVYYQEGRYKGMME